MVAPARCTVIGEVMDHLSKPQWLGCMTLICPDQFLQSTTGSFLQLLPLPFSVLSDSVSWSTPLISPLYSKVYHLPSCLSKSVKVLRGTPKTQILLIFTPIASLHITLCNLLCTFLPPPFRECSLPSTLIQKNVKQIFGGGKEGIHRKNWGVFNKILVSFFSWHGLGLHPCKDEAEYLCASQMNASVTLSREARGHRQISEALGEEWEGVWSDQWWEGQRKFSHEARCLDPTAEYACFGVRVILVTDQKLERGSASLLRDALGMLIRVFSVWWLFVCLFPW